MLVMALTSAYGGLHYVLDDVGHGLCVWTELSKQPTENMEGIMRAGFPGFSPDRWSPGAKSVTAYTRMARRPTGVRRCQSAVKIARQASLSRSSGGLPGSVIKRWIM